MSPHSQVAEGRREIDLFELQFNKAGSKMSSLFSGSATRCLSRLPFVSELVCHIVLPASVDLVGLLGLSPLERSSPEPFVHSKFTLITVAATRSCVHSGLI